LWLCGVAGAISFVSDPENTEFRTHDHTSEWLGTADEAHHRESTKFVQTKSDQSFYWESDFPAACSPMLDTATTNWSTEDLTSFGQAYCTCDHEICDSSELCIHTGNANYMCMKLCTSKTDCDGTGAECVSIPASATSGVCGCTASRPDGDYMCGSVLSDTNVSVSESTCMTDTAFTVASPTTMSRCLPQCNASNDGVSTRVCECNGDTVVPGDWCEEGPARKYSCATNGDCSSPAVCQQAVSSDDVVHLMRGKCEDCSGFGAALCAAHADCEEDSSAPSYECKANDGATVDATCASQNASESSCTGTTDINGAACAWSGNCAPTAPAPAPAPTPTPTPTPTP